MELSTVPTRIEDSLAPRYVDLRPFAVNDGNDVWVLPGGLTRVAQVEGHGWSIPVRAAGRRPPGCWRRAPWLPAVSWAAPKCCGRCRGPCPSRVPTIRGPTSSSRSKISRKKVSTSNNSSRKRRSDACPQRRSAVLDRSLRRARRRHRPNSRCRDTPAARGFQHRPDHASRLLLRVLGIDPPDHELDVWSLTDLVAFSTNASGGCSIVEAISAARENAKSAREVTSIETWECLNTTYHALPERERAAKRLGPHEFLSFVEGRAAMFAGLADSTLSRDDGYRFMLLGRAIERVDMTVRLLLSRVGDSASSPAWATLLRSVGAHDTYLHTYRGVLDAARVVEFMMLDRVFPRSVYYSLRMAEHNLDELLHNPHSRIGRPPKRSGCLGKRAANSSSSSPGSCWSPWTAACQVCNEPVVTSEKP
ncbi:A predicted alpha-helical domain with a conserved ER motif family protein [Mycobacterium ulcerans str. Harvey]|uniref:A predicted alpha-helical domain with a conserved ER motif family protein n=1 Tax=Mycobacterium ulcerans str. Harvey TaxID=1299332 RepID=A0ABP3AD97_MYCUL|nr:A predicted alpha-helical domain with a conserved ER motif family protein [Mycobacterium ulcerans str. Harvey]